MYPWNTVRIETSSVNTWRNGRKSLWSHRHMTVLWTRTLGYTRILRRLQSEFHIRSTDVLQRLPAGAQIDPFLSLQLKVGFFCQMQTGSKLNSQTSVVSLRDSGNFGDSDIYLIVFTVFSSSLISFTGLILSDIDRLILSFSVDNQARKWHFAEITLFSEIVMHSTVIQGNLSKFWWVLKASY